jgi:hypothetical protein
MNAARRRKLERDKEYRKKAYNQNDPLWFGIITMIDLVKIIVWVLLGANILYLTFNYCNPSDIIYDKSWPYNMKNSNYLFAWFARTLITSWHSSRNIFKSILNYMRVTKEWKQTALVFLGPFVAILSVVLAPIIGFFTTFYGAYRYGSDSCNHGMIGIIISVILFFTGLLFVFSSIVGVIQLFYLLVVLLIIPLTSDKGLANVSNVFYENKGKISLIFAIFTILNAFKYLNQKIGVGMVVALVLTTVYNLVSS